jgi:hypothetical protein
VSVCNEEENLNKYRNLMLSSDGSIYTATHGNVTTGGNREITHKNKTQ